MRRHHQPAGLLAAALLALATLAAPARSQQAELTRDEVISQLGRFDSGPSIDLAALRQRVAERSRSRSRNEPPPQKRPPIAPELLTLPGVAVEIQFDTDTPVVRPGSYQMLGRIADALVHANLLGYEFLIVGHIEATGRREDNALLSQRRADAIRDVLVNTFKISSKRLQSIGLGEEQLLDPAHPTAPINQEIQILTVAKVL